jgi:hypothetical protein
MQFKLNDQVRWSSQSAGRTVEKTGTIIEIVAVGVVPTTFKPKKSAARPRNHESYVVRATTPNGQTSNYWPLVRYLRLRPLHEVAAQQVVEPLFP